MEDKRNNIMQNELKDLLYWGFWHDLCIETWYDDNMDKIHILIICGLCQVRKDFYSEVSAAEADVCLSSMLKQLKDDYENYYGMDTIQPGAK